MLALGAVGRETEAIAAYDAGRLRIADELGVDPGTRLRSAYEQVIRQDLPLQGAASVHRLRTVPPASTDLIGRDRDLADLARLLERPDVRLVTLVGPAGIGKSRLAEMIARRCGGGDGPHVGRGTADALAVPWCAVSSNRCPRATRSECSSPCSGERGGPSWCSTTCRPVPAAAVFVDDLLAAVPGFRCW